MCWAYADHTLVWLLQGVTAGDILPHDLALPATLSSPHGLLDTEMSTDEWGDQPEHHELAQVAAAC